MTKAAHRLRIMADTAVEAITAELDAMHRINHYSLMELRDLPLGRVKPMIAAF